MENNKIKILENNLSILIDALINNNIEKRISIIKEINKNGFYGLEIQKIQKISKILKSIENNINTIDEKEKYDYVSKLSSFKFGLNNVTKYILIFILLFIIIETYLFGYIQTESSAMTGLIIMLIFIPLLYGYLYFFTDKFKNNKIKNKSNNSNIYNENKDNVVKQISNNDNLKNKKTKDISIKNQIIKIIIGIIWLIIAINIMMPLVDSHGFNGLMVIIHPGLWGIIVGPILIINSIYNIIFYFLIKKFKNNKNKILIIKNIIGLLLFSIIPIFYFIWGIKLMSSNNPFSSIYDFPFISGLLIVLIGYHLRKNYLNYKNINYGKKDFNT